MNIDRILLIIIIIYLIISHFKKNKNIENFAVTDDIRATVKEIYNTDMQAVRDLDKLAKDIQSGGYTVNGNLTTNALTVNGAFNLLPRGTIVAFNSTSAPSGWTLCDGSNGSPDLRGKFIRMWNNNTGGFDGNGAKLYGTSFGSTYNAAWSGHHRDDQQGYILQHSFGSYAGSDLHHQHVNEMASHNHSITEPNNGQGHAHNMANGMGIPYGSNTGWCTSCDGRGSQPGTQYSTTGITINYNGSGWGFSKQPPYYVLTWIMKL